MLEAALELLAAGQVPIPWRPVRGGDKRPLVAWTQYREAPPSVELVRSWWQRWPDAGLMRIIPAGQVVVDFDPRNGGLEALSALGVEDRAAVLSAPLVWSGRGDGGLHAWFATERDLPRGAVLPGVDLLPAGTLEIVAPSLHPATGLAYSAENGAEALAVPPCSLPAALTPNPGADLHQGSGGAGRRGRGDGTPLTPAQTVEWQTLWQSVGISLRSGEADYRCPWHEDRSASLSVQAETGRWCCHAGCGAGGLRALRERLRVSVSLGRPVPPATAGEGARPEVTRETRAPSATCPNLIPIGWQQGRVVEITGTSCGMKSCVVCGPASAAATAAPVLAALEAEGLSLFSQVLEPQHLRAWKARVDRAGHPRKQYPAPGGRWLTFTTWDREGSEVEDPERELLEAFHAAASDRSRRISGSRCWAVTHAVDQAEVEAETRPGWECLGVVTASELWSLKQAERITGTPVERTLDAQGRQVGLRILLSEDPAEAAEQVELLKFTLGIHTHAELPGLREARRAARQSVEIPEISEVSERRAA